MSNFLATIVIWVIIFIIGVYITRWIFGINKIIAHMKYQSQQLTIISKLIGKMASKQELTPEEVKKIAEITDVEYV